MNRVIRATVCAWGLMGVVCWGQLNPLKIDLTVSAAEAVETDLGQGTNRNPAGDVITADSRSFFLNGTPWIPVAGEFHYSRYPVQEWRDELLKMKAGGINVVPTYVFWIHHQEERGTFDWSGQRSLRRFVELCGELGLKVIVRMGPWCHGEVRNGGFPDWVQNSGVKLRSTDPAFMAMVQPLYHEISKQIEGLLWKDGGPVIGVQLENECHGVSYLLALKKLAQTEGVDVPLYTMTGWNRVAIPEKGLLPLFGAYSVAFWYPHSNVNWRKSFFFTDIRDDGDMGAQFENKNAGRVENMLRYPYVCCEIGGGMPSSYTKRVKVEADEIAAMALVRLGCGSNMPGYYMYHGGVNPDGKTHLNEEQPNAMPVKDYDFQAPIGAYGQVREHLGLLRMQHLFIEDFGQGLARMPLYLPEQRPAGLDDVESVRWSVRSDGRSGFVFVNNYQPVMPLEDKKDVQFELKMSDGVLTMPRKPMTIGGGAYGILPFGMDCDGVRLEYATVQPVCRIETGERVTYFFSALRGVTPELVLRTAAETIATNAQKEQTGDGVRVFGFEPGTDNAAVVKGAGAKEVAFVVLPLKQAKCLSRVHGGGREMVVLSKATVLEDGCRLRLVGERADQAAVGFYPAPTALKVNDAAMQPVEDGVFRRFSFGELCAKPELKIDASQVKRAGSEASGLKATDEKAWEEAAVWKLDIRDAAEGRLLLNIHYIGDAARVYVDDKLVDDNYFNGKPFALGLWRIDRQRWDDIRIKILPYTDAIGRYLPEDVKEEAAEAKKRGKLNEVSIETVRPFDVQVEAEF